jgi:IMP cyclohydrolase
MVNCSEMPDKYVFVIYMCVHVVKNMQVLTKCEGHSEQITYKVKKAKKTNYILQIHMLKKIRMAKREAQM